MTQDARSDLPPLALTMGDPGGVGAEISLKAWRALKDDGPVFFLIGAEAQFEKSDVALIGDPSKAAGAFASGLPLLPLEEKIDATLGIAFPKNAKAIIESIERAVAYSLEGKAAGVVTNPIQKSSLNAAGFRFPGHTEFIGALTENVAMPGGRMRGPVMMLAGPELRTVPVTVHASVKDAAASLTPDMIFATAMTTFEALKFDFGIEAPRLAISGLNPHAGEGGMLGAEDGMIIAPAIDRLRDAGLDVRGPLPADTMFHAEARARYDAAICMLHDQALIPAKTLAFHDAVNVTIGLPVIRTSPDHGTALDIAGKNVARADSLIAAIKLAASMAKTRRAK